MEIFVARQPILDKDYNVFAYELLYRESKDNIFNSSVSDNMATSMLLLNSYLSFGIENLVDESKAFINFDAHLIQSGVAELLNKDKVIIEILETVIPNAVLMEKLRKIKESGYILAIDDYSADYKYNEIAELCDIVKVDFVCCSKEEIHMIVKEMKLKGKTLLAEKVETKEEFEWAKSVGFDYYQGYFFARPSVKKRKALTSSALQYVKLMNELNNAEPNFQLLSDIIILDVSLTYKLLKLVNSNTRVNREITSIKQAIAILGLKEFERWLSLAMVENMSNHETDEAVKYAMIRSNLLKEIALNSKFKNEVDELSLMGMLSVIDGILEIEMSDVLESLPLVKEMKDTLIGKKTRYSDVMSLCYAYERGIFEDVEKCAANIDYDLKKLPMHYVSSVSWAEKMFKELKNTN